MVGETDKEVTTEGGGVEEWEGGQEGGKDGCIKGGSSILCPSDLDPPVCL